MVGCAHRDGTGPADAHPPHNVRLHRSGAKHFHRPVVGDLTLGFEAMELSADTGLTLTAYTAEPGSASEDALKLLASWAATHDQANQAATTHPTGLASP